MTERDAWALGAGSLAVLALSLVAWWAQRRRRPALLPAHRFEEIARSIEIADPAVKACWVYVIDAVKSAAHADDLLVALSTGHAVGYGEFGVEIEGEEVAVWSGLGETMRCPRAGLEAALTELSKRAHASLAG